MTTATTIHWTDRIIQQHSVSSVLSPQLLIILQLMHENPFEHPRYRTQWWETLANTIMTMIIQRDLTSIAYTQDLLAHLIKLGSANALDHGRSQRLLGYIDLLESAKTHL